MSREYVVTLGDVEYKGRTASAKAQFEAMHVALRTSIMSILDEGKDYSEMAVVGFFARVPFEEIQRIQKLLVADQIVRRDDDVPVAENLFADNMQDYYLLIYHALRENLGGFWQLHRPTGGAVEQVPNS